MSGLPAGAIAVEDLNKIVAALSGIDFEQVLRDIRAGNPQIIIGDLLLVAQVGTKDAGYFVPMAAQASQWIGAVRMVEPQLFALAVWANAHLPPPHQLQPGEISAWGHTFNGSLLQGDFPK